MKTVLLTPLILISASMAQLRTDLSCWSDQSGLYCNPGLNSAYPQYNDGVPRFSSFQIKEFSVLTSTGQQMIAFDPANGIHLSGSLVYSEFTDPIYNCQGYHQNYTVGPEGKIAQVAVSMCHFEADAIATGPGVPRGEIIVEVNWWNGAPSSINGFATNLGIGLVNRVDHDPYVGAGNSTMETSGNHSLRPILKNTWTNVTPNGDWMGSTTSGQLLARFAEPNGFFSSGKNYDLYWQKMDAWTTHYMKACRYAELTQYASENCDILGEPPLQALSYGNNSATSFLPGFVAPGGGQDQMEYLVTYTQNPSMSEAFYTRHRLLYHQKVGKRSIRLSWVMYHSGHNNPDFKGYTDIGGVKRSVREALQTLVASDPGSDVIIEAPRLRTDARCPSYGNLNSICTPGELMMMESGTGATRYNLGAARYNADVIFIQNTSTLEGAPNAAGVVYTRNLAGQTGLGLITRAFLFTKLISNSNDLYLIAAHEIGHTLGFGHQWSNCNENDGGTGMWNCPNGTIMSYSATPKMDYGADARNWFTKAPVAWTHPRLGYGPIYSRTLEPNNIINW